MLKGFGNNRAFFPPKGVLRVSVSKPTSSYCLPPGVDSVPAPRLESRGFPRSISHQCGQADMEAGQFTYKAWLLLLLFFNKYIDSLISETERECSHLLGECSQMTTVARAGPD